MHSASVTLIYRFSSVRFNGHVLRRRLKNTETEMEHKNSTNTQNKTLSKQTKHDMAEENSM